MTIAGLILLKLAGLGILYLALAGALFGRIARRRDPAPAELPSVTILKPLHGAEPDLRANLASFVEQDYPGAVQIVFGLASPADPAAAIVRELQAAYSDRDLVLVIDRRQHGTNRKVSNLVNMAERSRHEVVVLADSDMRVAPDYLRGLVAALARPGTGAVTCLYHGLPAATLPSRLMALGIDTQFLPGVAMGVGLGIGNPCMGSTIALRQDTLEEIGGFRALSGELADDHALGAKVRALGLRVEVAPFTVGHTCPDTALGELWDQELRWARTIRQVEPLGHAGSVLAHPLLFALAGFAAWPGLVSAGVVTLAIAARIGVCLAAERAFGLKRHSYWLVPVRDVLSFGVFVASFVGRGVSWRGYRYDIDRSGAMLPKMPAAHSNLSSTLLSNTRPDPT